MMKLYRLGVNLYRPNKKLLKKRNRFVQMEDKLKEKR